MIAYTEIAARIFDVPLLVHPGKAHAIVHALGDRLLGSNFVVDGAAQPVDHVAFDRGRPSAGKIGDRLGRYFDARGVVPVDMVGNVAIIPIEGTLVHKGAFVGSYSGRTSYQGLQTQITRAARSPDVKGVVFEVDSFGGEVAGAFQTAEMIAQLSAAKPTIAIMTDNALSAGYLLASQARSVIAPEEGRAGSIGVITMHVDYSRQLENAGVKVTIIAAGKHKADGNPFEKLPDALAARMRTEVEAARVRFADAVGRGRGSRFSSAAAMGTEAQDFQASEAARLGLIDAVGDTHQAFEVFVKAVNSK